MKFRDKVIPAIEEVFGNLVSKEACNALYIIAESMYNTLGEEDAKYVRDCLQHRLKTMDEAFKPQKAQQ